MRLFLFALLFRFDKKLFYPFVLRTISTFKCYAYCVVARSVVNTQHSTGCLIACFPGMTSLLPKVNRSSGAHFQTFSFLKFSYFLIFLNIQIDLIILDTDVEQVTLTTKKIIAFHFKDTHAYTSWRKATQM